MEDEVLEREAWSKVSIQGDRLYVHKTLRINFTTYDVRAGQDTMNPRTRPDVMTLKRRTTDKHPYSYARIIGIFHVKVQYKEVTHDMDVLLVRWFKVDTHYHSGIARKRLTRLEFVGGSNTFGCLDPDEVIRGSHVIPAFAYGPTEGLLSHSIARQCFHANILETSFTWPKEEDIEKDDYRYYYVNL